MGGNFIALSGGLDSHVLLHQMKQRQQLDSSIQLTAIHIHHGLQPEADAWAAHCEQLCDVLAIPCLVRRVHVDTQNGQSVEAAARHARYQVFAELMGDGCLLTAHHQDDQAETVLLQMLRGAGVKGLSAMPKRVRFAGGWHERPLLETSRRELEAYAKDYELVWVDDTSNDNCRFDRNFLRHIIMPLLRERWPSVDRTLSRVAKHCAEAQVLLDEMAVNVLDSHGCKNDDNSRDNSRLSLSALRTLSPEAQRNVLRHWLSTLKLPMPSEVKLKEIQRQMLTAKPDRKPVVEWQGGAVRRRRDYIST